MLRCQPFRAASQRGGSGRFTSGSRAPSGSRLPSGQLAARCASAPDAGGGGGKRRVRSLPEQAAEQMQRSMLGGDTPFGEPADGDVTQAAAGAPAAAAAAGSSAPPPEPGSWDDWMAYFYHLDDVVHELHSLQADLEEAVGREDYRAAAAIKAQQAQLERGDCVAAALDALEAAVAEERFADAARLRDAACVGLQGWWVGRGEGDPSGHLLRVQPDFARYVGTALSPRDIADMLPELQGDPRMAAAAALLGSPASSPAPEAAAPQSPDDAGLPVLELFLRPSPDGEGYEQQPVALYAPNASLTQQGVAQEGADAVAETIAEMINAAGVSGDALVSVEEGQAEDGSTYVKVEISSIGEDGDTDGEGGGEGTAAKADAAGEEEGEGEQEEDFRTIDDLAASVGITPAADPATAGGAAAAADASAAGASADQAAEELRADEEAELARWQEAAAGGDGGEDGAPRRRSLREEVAAMAQSLLRDGPGLSDAEGGSGQPGPGLGGGGDDDSGQSLAGAASQLGCYLQRAPAQLEWQGRDRFVVTVTEPPAVAAARAAAEAAAAAAQQAAEEEPPQLQRPPLRIIYDGREQQRRGRGGSRPQAGGEGAGSQADTEGAADAGALPSGSDSEDVSVFPPPSSQQQQQQRQPDAGRGAEEQQEQQEQQGRQQPGDAAAQDSAALAEQIESLKGDLEAGRKPSKDKLNEVARRALGLAIAQGIGAVDAAGGSRWAALDGRTTYERLRLSDCVKTDPFSGLYVGSFGPHGPELLQVSRQQEGGAEWAVATKLTGDPNVPAGTVTWKALIGRAQRLPADLYPPEMGVTARYKGQGQVAQKNFTNAQWVDGELLVFNADSPFVRGAQLGFTYSVRANQRYLIVLHRVNLDELFPEDSQ